MSSKCSLTINGQQISARRGSSLVDAALSARIIVPTDCSSGQCETCRVRVVSGDVDDAGTASGDTVLACQATVRGDAEIAFDETPAPARIRGEIASIDQLAPEIVQVVIDLDDPLPYRPGQYLKVRFPGCPSRDYSPTVPADGAHDDRVIVLHIRLYPRGAVSAALRSRIRRGDRLWVEGPYGSSYYRKGDERLLLIGTNTGWAPLWAIARAARIAEPHRPMRIVLGARDPRHLYMRDALDWLRRTGVDDITLSSTGEVGDAADVVAGRTTRFLGPVQPKDIVYTAGAPAMVEAVKEIASRAGAACYADPFTTGATAPSFFGRLRQVIETGDETRLNPRRSTPAERVPAAETSSRTSVEVMPAGPRQRRAGVFSRWLDRS